MKKYCYLFSEGNGTMRELLGGKGANLCEMTHIGLPVPQGFTITTEACTQYYEDGRKINDEIMAEIMVYVEKMEAINGKKFGDLENPLLVSVRSGARASMPGMMDTILNLGLNDEARDAAASARRCALSPRAAAVPRFAPRRSRREGVVGGGGGGAEGMSGGGARCVRRPFGLRRPCVPRPFSPPPPRGHLAAGPRPVRPVAAGSCSPPRPASASPSLSAARGRCRRRRRRLLLPEGRRVGGGR